MERQVNRGARFGPDETINADPGEGGSMTHIFLEASFFFGPLPRQFLGGKRNWAI